MAISPLDYRITIRDYGYVTGGGRAVAHHSTCHHLNRSAATEQAASHFDHVSDFRCWPNWTTQEAIQLFRNQWTVPVPVRKCECTGNLAEREVA